MREFKLIRVARNADSCSGVLVLDRPICLTLEPPWQDNQVNCSCVPVGHYVATLVEAKPTITAGHGQTYQLLDVPNRSEILFHIGNFSYDTKGCILTGSSFAMSGGLGALLDSKEAFVQFIAATNHDDKIGVEICEV